MARCIPAKRAWEPASTIGSHAINEPDRLNPNGLPLALVNPLELAGGSSERETPRDDVEGLRVAPEHHRAGGPEERRGKIPGMRPISERPAEAKGRSRLGDWEGDTVVGKGGGACLVTLVDRTSGLLEGGRAGGHNKAEVARTEEESLGRQAEVRTLTLDRGKEFAGFAEVVRVGVVTYFADPHHPWQRGANENTNGLLREYFPKGTDFGPVSAEEVRAVYDEINRRPRKRLGYRTPYEVHYSTVLHLL